MLCRILVVVLVLFASPLYAGSPEVVQSLSVGRLPASVAIDEKGDRAFVALASGKGVSVIGKDVKSGKYKVIKKIVTTARYLDPNMGANGLSYDPETERLYLPDIENSFYILDLKTFKQIKVVSLERGANAWMSAVNVDRGSKGLAVLDWYGYLHSFDKDGRKIEKEIDIGIKGVKYQTLSYDGRTMYITDLEGGSLLELSMRGKSIISRYDIRANTVPLIDKESGYVYVGVGGAVHKISDRGSIANVDVGIPTMMGYGMALNPATGHLFAPTDRDSVVVIDVKEMKILKELKVGRQPRSIAVNTKTNMVYVTCLQNNKIVIIQDR